MTGEDGFSNDDLRRLDEIANRTFHELSEIPTARAELETLTQALCEAAGRLSDFTHELLHSEVEAVSVGEGQ